MRVLVIDQFYICREGMRVVVQQMDSGCDFFGVDTVKEAIAIPGGDPFDLIIVDLDVPEVGAMGMLDRIKSSSLMGNFVIFSTSGDFQVMRRAYEMGISAYIREQTKKEIILSVFQIVLAGGRYFSPEVVSDKGNYSGKSPSSRFLIDGGNRAILSKRQMQVLRLLAEGKPNKIIARELEIATGTVKVHIAGILRSLKAKNRTQAVSIANHINIL